MRKNYSIFFVLVFFFFIFCKTSLLKKKEIEQINQEFSAKKYVALLDISLFYYDFKNQNYEVLDNALKIKKGTISEIMIESSEDWLRIRCFDTLKDKKNHKGEVIFFLSIEDIEDDGIKLNKEKVLEILQTFLTKNFKEIK